jgi:hypothetical protein
MISPTSLKKQIPSRKMSKEMTHRPKLLTGLLVSGILLATSSAWAATWYLSPDYGVTLTTAERDGFLSGITGSLIDAAEFGALDAPAPATDITSVTSPLTTINGNGYLASIQEGGYTGGGTFSTLGTDITDLGNPEFGVEAAIVHVASGLGWGVDSTEAPNTSSAQSVFVVDFTASPTDVYSASASLLDFESASQFLRGYVVAYDESGNLIDFLTLNYDGAGTPTPAASDGNGQARMFGITTSLAEGPIGSLAYIVGDDSTTSSGFNEHLGIGDFYVGGAAAIPEPGGGLLLILGLLPVALARRRRHS